MFARRLPAPETLRIRLAAAQAAPFSYPMPGCTQQPARYPGYDTDAARTWLGTGPEVYAAACAALRAWQMFPAGWTCILPADAPIRPGTPLTMNARFLGLWWHNSCRIVYVIDEPGRFGFAYGTLPAHMERGEELFLITRDADGGIWYEIRAVSRPQRLIARLAYPLMRLLQARFRRDSARQMRAAAAAHPEPALHG